MSSSVAAASRRSLLMPPPGAPYADPGMACGRPNIEVIVAAGDDRPGSARAGPASDVACSSLYLYWWYSRSLCAVDGPEREPSSSRHTLSQNFRVRQGEERCMTAAVGEGAWASTHTRISIELPRRCTQPCITWWSDAVLLCCWRGRRQRASQRRRGPASNAGRAPRRERKRLRLQRQKRMRNRQKAARTRRRWKLRKVRRCSVSVPCVQRALN